MPRRRSDQPIKVYGPGERKGNRYCVIKGRLPDGTEIDKTLHELKITDPAQARSIADEYYRAAQERADQGGRPAGPQKPTTFGELAEKYLTAEPRSRQTQKNVRLLIECQLPSLGLKLGNVAVTALIPGVASEAATVLRHSRTPQSVNRHVIKPYIAILNFGRKAYEIPSLGAKLWRAPDRIRYPATIETEEALLAAAAAAQPEKCSPCAQDFVYRHLLLLFLFRQGWRISETLRLTWHDVNLRERRFFLRVDKSNNPDKPILMQREIVEALAALPPGEAERALE
jgi:hypothetical protein